MVVLRVETGTYTLAIIILFRDPVCVCVCVPGNMRKGKEIS